MNETLDIIYAVISGCSLDIPNQIMTVFFEPVEYHGILLMKSFLLTDNSGTVDFFKTCPAFTKDGMLDFDCLEGSRVFLKFSRMKCSMNIEQIEFDIMYYYDSSQAERLNSFDKELEGGNTHGKI